MKTVAYIKHVPPEDLGFDEVENPVPKDNEVQIRGQTVEATKSDVEMHWLKFAVKWFRPP